MGLASRLYRGETSFNFVGRRWWGFGFSILLLALTVGSLAFRGLNLGIDFTGGVAWEVPSTTVSTGDVEDVLAARGIDVAGAKVQELTGAGGRRIRAQVGDQPAETVAAVRADLATAAGVNSDAISVASVSSSWGRSITEKAVRALETTLGPWQGGFEQMATFLDAFTDTYQHTGVQAVARRLVERAAAEI